ncbi:hypothetical protein PH586_03720 [Pseudomonas sp. SA3-5]|uniref:Uncharacterized protein n=1 Tax=Pseudomonas aestuarii TaxID=3018340 RepID=A0ABT4XBC3_9PSED|nr:hypothetical protein [Pseudomonas aestuarii]MDA7085500.1 hypothetical protein [Pseudomonas aestuarii]
MKNQNGAHAPMGSACPNLASRYLLTLALSGADLVLLIALEVLLWIA